MKELSLETLDCEFKVEEDLMNVVVKEAFDELYIDFHTMHLTSGDNPEPIVFKSVELIILYNGAICDTQYADMFIISNKYIDLVPESISLDSGDERIPIGIDLKELLSKHGCGKDEEQSLAIFIEENTVNQFVLQYDDTNEMYRIVGLAHYLEKTGGE